MPPRQTASSTTGDEARRFLRFVFPGLLALLELGILLAIAAPAWFITSAAAVLSEQGLGAVIAAFLVSGGVGYLLGVIHHTTFGLHVNGFVYGLDYRGVLESARRVGHLKLGKYDAAKGNADDQPLTQEGAWRVVTAIWHSERLNSSVLEGGLARAESLSDLVHGAGASLAGATLALLTWVVVLCFFRLGGWTLDRTSAGLLRLFLAILVAIFVLGLHIRSYRQLRRYCQGFISIVLAKYLADRARLGSSYELQALREDFVKRRRSRGSLFALVVVLVILVGLAL